MSNTQEHTTSPSPTLPKGLSSKALTSFKVVKDHYGFYRDLYERFEDPVFVPTMNGDAVITKDPELIRQIFAHAPEDYLPFAVGAIEGFLGKRSLLVLKGKEHREERKLLMPSFHGDRMRAYGEAMQHAAKRQLDKIAVGEQFIAQEITTDTSLEVIVRTVFGVLDDSLVEQLQEAINTLVAKTHPATLFFKGLQKEFMGFGPWAKFLKALKVVEEQLYAQIEAREADPSLLGEDILSMLMQSKYEDGQGMTKEHIRDELLTLLVAGHETTGVALAWALYHLHKHPETLEKLRAELEEHADAGPNELARQPYLNAVCHETLRLYPIVPDILRELKAPIQLGRYTVPAGKLVGVAIVAVHHDPELYPEPMKFEPERFIERKFKPWEYMPFGGGHRRCIGAAFASYELAVVLATWLKESRFELLDEVVVAKRRNVTLGPDTGVRMRRCT